MLNSGPALSALFLFWGMMLPLGARWPLDARKRGAPAAGAVLTAAGAALLGQVALVYFFAAAYKLIPSGPCAATRFVTR